MKDDPAASALPPQVRKYVVVLFIDLVGSTALAERLDPEPLRRLLDRYYAICSAAIAEYGGVLEKFIGDAVMAVFGVPIAHEDDALRAIRAAAAVRRSVADMGDQPAGGGGQPLRVHCGIASGEAVVIARDGRDVRVVGDVVSTAARLQSVAVPDEIVLADDTAWAVRTAIKVDRLPPLELKGKAHPVAAWRVMDLAALVDERMPAAFEGRTDELQQLERAYDRVRQRRQPCLVSVLGAPGIGKSRLVGEFLAGLERDSVTVLRGSCPSHGVGLTYRPLAELIESLPNGWADVTSALAAERTGERAVGTLAAGAGHADAARGSGVEEMAWATRLLVELLARRAPLILALDDLQWAEPTFLELVTEIATWVTDAPVLLMCMARTELLESRPTWGGGVACALTLELGALSTAETARLVDDLARAGEVVGHAMEGQPQLDDARDRIVIQCGGNPLFASLMVELLLETGPGASVPPTIRPLLEARLDRLPGQERQTLQQAAAIGTAFTLSQLTVLRGSDRDAGDLVCEVDRTVRQLLRRRLLQRGSRPDEFRFENALLRETAYVMTSKEQRAAWHLALADQLSASGRSGPAAEELALHLESAYLLRREVDPTDITLADLRVRAAHALVGSGSRAQHRRDLAAAVSLLERGWDLLPDEDPEQCTVALRVSDAWLGLGVPASAVEAVSRAAASPDPQLRRISAIQREIITVRSGRPPGDLTTIVDDLERHPDDDLGWCRIHQVLALRHLLDGRVGAAEAELRAALDRTSTIGRYEQERVLAALCEVAQWSPTPIPECLLVCEQLSERFSDDRALLVPVTLTAARLYALSGRIRQAHQYLAAGRGDVADMRLPLAAVAVSQIAGLLDSLTGSHAAAAGHYRAAASALRDLGQSAVAPTLDLLAARELLRDGRRSEAAAAFRAVDPGPLDMRGTLIALALRAALVAGDGRAAEAVTVARQAIDGLHQTDDPCLAGDVYFEVARAYAATEESDAMRSTAGRAIDSYLRKGAVLPARSVRAWLNSQEVGGV